VQEFQDFEKRIRRYSECVPLISQSKFLHPVWIIRDGFLRFLNCLFIRSYGGKRRDLSNRVYATDEQRDYAINAAQELEEELGSDYPIFVKPMLQSHVTGGFWLVSL
jgi:hypothetical protein